MQQKDGLGEIQSDGAHLVHGCLLEWPATPLLWHTEAAGASTPSMPARMVLEPWLVEEALARLGDRRLSLDEQAKVVRVVRTPSKVRWPDWWEIRSVEIRM